MNSQKKKKTPRLFIVAFKYFVIIIIFTHTNEVATFLNLLETKFDIICITESRLSQKNQLKSNINIPGYNIIACKGVPAPLF